MADTKPKMSKKYPHLTLKQAKQQAQDNYRASEKFQEKAWSAHLKRKYGMTGEEYDSLLLSQNYACRICRAIETDRGWRQRKQRASLFVDHCHTTGRVRGLLCHQCNAGLGMFRDSPELLATAISYLRENA